MLKKYRVGIFEEQGGYIIVEAKNEDEAREIADNYVSEFGMDRTPEGASEQYPQVSGLDVTHRDTFIVDEPEIEGEKNNA